MKEFEYNWTTNDNIEIYGKCWLPKTEEPKAIVCLIHGFGEHILRYNHVAKFFNDNGIGFIGYDQRGHGQTKGKRGVVPSYADVLYNVSEFLALVNDKFPNIPMFLYGHSMGGNIALSFLLKEQPLNLKGAIITSPWLRLASDPPAWQEQIGKFIGSIIKGFVIPSKLNPPDLSSDLSVGEEYVKDPLVHNKICTALYFGVKDAGEWNIKNADNLKTPTLLMHGTADNITSDSASKEFSENAPASLISFKKWNNLRHEMHNEVTKEEVLKDMLTFIEKELA
ncbi:alpha/beta hydrolase [Flammeovirga kamogawensis]|uniref:Lysophospholipase n=1 Tax=Flammeovirga kamogawensis TaxID=373891 RepID=A0ABX8GUW0_9BACT|nr:alpha/beta hydrolase [Flammeovirga kamogawensis]MBB6459753.1 alpha-beta hydrolase superfamily lysophospholipase [Flammeovirga kamogawensis]QWG07188.1 lysophospholipase [Flammeovirga kamogawensis]TRX69009.1 lysophospholipase [Flammeovirga kamogawensis]